MIPNFRRKSTIPATSHTRHNAGPAEVPQQPHAAAVPTPTEVYAYGYDYRLSWPDYLRRCAERKRAEAADLNTKVQDMIALAARCCDEADDMEHLAVLVEIDQQVYAARAAMEERPEPRDLAGATGVLFNGWQTEVDAATQPLASVAEQATVTMPAVGGAR